MIKDRLLLVLNLCLTLSGCADINEGQLLGSWTAHSLTTDSTTYTKEVESVAINFKPDRQYHFSGTLGYQEDGNFELKDSFLLLNKKDSKMNPEILKIKRILGDTLIIEMKGQQLLTFVK